MSEKNIFAIRMKEARQKADISQAELSRRTGIAPATLSSYESAENPKNPTIDKVILIAKALNVSIDWLCGLESKTKVNEEITFNDVMNAFMLISSLNAAKIGFQKFYDEHGIMYSRVPTLSIDSKIFKAFILEYKKISEFIESSDYDNYLKESLKKAITDKFSQYVIRNGIIQSIDEEYEDTDIPCDEFDDAPF